MEVFKLGKSKILYIVCTRSLPKFCNILEVFCTVEIWIIKITFETNLHTIWWCWKKPPTSHTPSSTLPMFSSCALPRPRRTRSSTTVVASAPTCTPASTVPTRARRTSGRTCGRRSGREDARGHAYTGRSSSHDRHLFFLILLLLIVCYIGVCSKIEYNSPCMHTLYFFIVLFKQRKMK